MSEYDAKGCGCCTDGVHATGPEITNRPALPAIHYRIGTYGSFRRAMIEAIATQPQLAKWTARDATDYGMAVIDMWAYLGDILTFYQERIANEAFLRTAVQRDSVMRLAALLDYRPSPGAAATTYVALFLEKDKTLQVPVGLRIQSVPGQNEKPQKFETAEAIAASAALNAVRVHGVPVPFNPFAKGSTGGPLTALSDVAAGAALAIFDPEAIERKSVAAVTVADDIQTIAWSPSVQRAFPNGSAQAVITGRQFTLFGSETPAKTLVHEVLNPNTDKVGIKFTERDTQFAINTPDRLPLDRAVPDLKTGTRVLLVRSASGSAPAAVRMATVTANEAKPYVMKTTGNALLTNYAGTVTEVRLGLGVTSEPSAAMHDDGYEVFVVADDGAVWFRRLGGGSTWISLGGAFTSVLAVTGVNGKRQVVASDAAGRLWLHGSSGWASFGDDVRSSLGGGTSNGRGYLVAIGPDQKAALRRQLPNGSWDAWESLAGNNCDLVTTVTRNDGAIEVAIRRVVNHNVFARHENTVGGTWSAWQSVGGVVRDLTAGVHENGAVELFAIGMNNALWRSRRTGNNWAPWTSLSGWIDRLAIGRHANGKLHAFARGNNGNLYIKRQDAANSTTWTNWSESGGVVDHLATGRDDDGVLHCFIPSEGMLWQWKNNDTAFLGVPTFEIADRRRVTLVEVLGEPLPMATVRYPSTITTGPLAIPLAKLPSLEKGRTFLLDDVQKNPHVATVASTVVSGAHLLVSFTPGLTRTFDGATALLHGNVALVTHGETVKTEVLGSGAASERFQTFSAAKSPVTFVPQAGARNGVANTLEVRVDGVRWTEVETLYGRAKDERVFATRVSEDNKMTVRFGGEPGARLTTGRSNVTAKYRVGLGAEGNVRAAALTNLLDRPAGLKSAINPGPAQGGAAAEPLDGIRLNAPNTVRTFSRIVSLLDFEDAAREHATVAKARATWHVEDFERVVSLTVAPEGGAVLGSAALALIAADLDARRDVNRPMRIRAHQNVPFLVNAVLQTDPDHLLETVQKGAQDALASYFSFARRELGQAVHLSDIYALLQRVAGVVGARITTLKRKAGGPALGDHILLLPHELAQLQTPEDAVVTPQFATL